MVQKITKSLNFLPKYLAGCFPPSKFGPNSNSLKSPIYFVALVSHLIHSLPPLAFSEKERRRATQAGGLAVAPPPPNLLRAPNPHHLNPLTLFPFMPSIRTCIHSPSQIEIITPSPKSDSGEISSSPTCSCFKKVNPLLSFQFRAPLSLAFQFWNPISYFSLFLGFSTNRHRRVLR